jgi:phosphoribosylamine--glycine ligase
MLDPADLKINATPCVTVVMAAEGYPGTYAKGREITGLESAAALPDVCVFHAGTARHDGKVVTTGGRVLAVTAWADDMRAAVDRAYQGVAAIHFSGAHFRRDIARRALDRL